MFLKRRCSHSQSLDHAIQNGLQASMLTWRRDTPISCKARSLRFVNSRRKDMRLSHVAMRLVCWSIVIMIPSRGRITYP